MQRSASAAFLSLSRPDEAASSTSGMFARVLSVLALAPVVEGLQITTARQPLACFHPSSALRVPVLVAAVYERAEGDEGEVDVDKVNALIDERAELREARDFDSADAVRDELIDMGVTVLDNDMVWYVGDRPKGFREQCTYTRQAGNEVVEVDVEKVEELIMERAFLRRNRDFVGADEVRDALTEIGVRVLDREFEWYAMRKRTPGPPRERDFGPLGHDYTRAPDDKTELTEEVEAEINELIRKRLEAKMARRFEEVTPNPNPSPSPSPNPNPEQVRGGGHALRRAQGEVQRLRLRWAHQVLARRWRQLGASRLHARRGGRGRGRPGRGDQAA